MNCDFLVIGGGVVGLTVSRQLRHEWPDATVVLIEKEPEFGLHASGRNSGVLHAGFYYTADSLKARFTREGNVALRAFCREKGLRLNECGKLVVARDERELDALDELARRGDANSVPLEMVSEADAKRIEPRVKTYRRAIWSPTTATADPQEVTRALVQEAEQTGVRMMTSTAFLSARLREVRTSAGMVGAGYVVNCAGLHADRIAHCFGFGTQYRIAPFKGLYLYSSEPPGSFRTNIYPVPDLRNPFLGVHFTVTVDGRAKIGPTAIPCIGREQYGWVRGLRARDGVESARTMLMLMLRAGFDFRALAWQEVRKYWRPHMVRRAAKLAEGVHPSQYRTWGRPGIRAQLVDIRSRKLVMDFCLEGDDRSMHVLNAVSPAWTCAIPFAAHVCDEIAARVGC
ncbi:MAG: L-2-hydroxyglutarate oxidase [Fimbriimonadia bacterium]|jgi:L-2-hydroxyglutarate oxidase LhgO